LLEHCANAEEIAGESSAVPLEALYLEGMTQMFFRVAVTRSSTHLGISAGVTGEAKTDVSQRVSARRLLREGMSSVERAEYQRNERKR